MNYILQTHHLTKTLKGTDLIKDVSIHVKKGEIYGFLGPNGAGKTTVMKLITNLWKPTRGTVELFGETIAPSSYEMLKRMGSILEFPAFYNHLTGKENLKLHCEYMGYYKHGSVSEALEMLGLIRDADRPVSSYSLGMRQRLGIARALLPRPELLILDEPTNGLDPAGIKQIRDLFQMLCREYSLTFMISSHLLSEIENMADTIGVISQGRILRECPMKNISEMNTAYIELVVDSTKSAAYVLEEHLSLRNFKIMDHNEIRIYESGISTQDLTRKMVENHVAVVSVSQKAESLEDFFLKTTEEQGGQAYV